MKRKGLPKVGYKYPAVKGKCDMIIESDLTVAIGNDYAVWSKRVCDDAKEHCSDIFKVGKGGAYVQRRVSGDHPYNRVVWADIDD